MLPPSTLLLDAPAIHYRLYRSTVVTVAHAHPQNNLNYRTLAQITNKLAMRDPLGESAFPVIGADDAKFLFSALFSKSMSPLVFQLTPPPLFCTFRVCR